VKLTEQLKELRDLEAGELDSRLKQARRELYELRFKLAVGQLENNREIRKVRRDIARIFTVIHQHRMAGEEVVAIADAPEQEELAGADAEVEETADEAAGQTGGESAKSEEAGEA
jgi:large subunit ribosomal protein L29